MGCSGGKERKGAPAGNLRGQEQQQQQLQAQHPAPVQQHAAQQHSPAPVQQPVPQSAPVHLPAAGPIDPFLTPGYLIGNRYQPTSVIGQGGFGRTYMGTDQQTAQPVVIKLLLPSGQGVNGTPAQYTEQERAVFRQEADKLERLGQHPNIPQMLSYFELDTQLLLVQECVDGMDLWAETCQQGVTYTEPMIWTFLVQLLKIFDFCHCRANHAGGVIHRDVKPQNIMRRRHDQQYVLIDFGAAKSVAGLGGQATTIGTPGYQAPEISQGQCYFASDLFSLGATIVFLLGRSEPSAMGGAQNWRNHIPLQVSDMLAAVLEGLLKFNPAERFQDAAGVIRYIQAHAPQLWQTHDTCGFSCPSLTGIAGNQNA